MVRERSALVFELLQLGDDSYALAEFVGNGLVIGRFDRSADNSSLFAAWSAAISGLLREGFLVAYVNDVETAELSEERLLDQYQHHLYDAQQRVEVMTTPKGEALNATLLPVMATRVAR
jgi:hypothetical protein